MEPFVCKYARCRGKLEDQAMEVARKAIQSRSLKDLGLIVRGNLHIVDFCSAHSATKALLLHLLLCVINRGQLLEQQVV